MLLFNKTLYFLQRSMWSGLYSLVLSNIHWCYQLVLLVLSIGVDCNSLGPLPLRLGMILCIFIMYYGISYISGIIARQVSN